MCRVYNVNQFLKVGNEVVVHRISVAQLVSLLGTSRAALAREYLLKRGREALAELAECLQYEHTRVLAASVAHEIEGAEELIPTLVEHGFGPGAPRCLREALTRFPVAAVLPFLFQFPTARRQEGVTQRIHL